jgi:hypothetical protein
VIHDSRVPLQPFDGSCNKLSGWKGEIGCLFKAAVGLYKVRMREGVNEERHTLFSSVQFFLSLLQGVCKENARSTIYFPSFYSNISYKFIYSCGPVLLDIKLPTAGRLDSEPVYKKDTHRVLAHPLCGDPPSLGTQLV